MKKIISLFLVILIITSFSFSAYTEENATNYNWESVIDIIKSFPENSIIWHIEEVDALMWLPGSFSPVELTAEDLETNCIGYFVSQEGETNAFVYLIYSDDGITLDMYYTALVQNSNNVERLSVNGIPAILYWNEENDALFLIFQTQEGKLFQVMFSPLSDETYGMIFDLVISSIRPNVEDAVEEPTSCENPVSRLISK